MNPPLGLKSEALLIPESLDHIPSFPFLNLLLLPVLVGCCQKIPHILSKPSEHYLTLMLHTNLGWASQMAQWVKNPPANSGDTQEMWVRSLGREDPLEEGMATPSRILARRIPWTEAPGGCSP